MKLEWYLARRYLASRQGRQLLSLITLIAMGGVFVGVTALVVVTAVMTGLQTDLRNKILGTNPHIWVLPFGDAMRMEDWRQALERVRHVEGVEAAAPFIHTEVGLRNEAGYPEFAILRGIAPNVPGRPINKVSEDIRAGRLSLAPTRSGHAPLLLGEKLAERFGVSRGDFVTVISLQGQQINAFGGFTPRLRRFEVAGTFRTGMYEYDNKFMYTRLDSAQALLGLGGGVTGLELRTPDPMRAELIGERVGKALGFGYRVEDWKRMNSALFSALKLEKLALTIILLLIVVVAAFNIVSTLVMVVADKTREIGILKSMGLSSGRVLRIFMLQGMVIGLSGAVLGCGMGLLLVYLLDRYRFISLPGEVYFIDHLPVAVDPVDVGVIVVCSIAISFLATLYPARQASRLLPVDAIRHE